MPRAHPMGANVPLLGGPCQGMSPAGCRRAGLCCVWGRLRRLVMLCAIVWSVQGVSLPAAASEELIGLKFDRQTLETLLVHKRGGRFWLPLAEVGEALSLQPIDGAGAGSGNGLRLATPLGPVEVPASAIFRSAATRYIDQRFLETRLNATFAYEANTAILSADMPWLAGARPRVEAPGGAAAPLEAEVGPPEMGLATLHGDIAYTIEDDRRDMFEGVLRATGHAWGGVWQVVYEEDLLARHAIRDAIWMKQIDDNRFVQAGHQSVALHPLLDSVEMSGVQFAWTNVPPPRRTMGVSTGALLERRVDHARTFSGTGPVGGLAELWLDDRLYARQPIAISGTFSFADIPLPARQNRIEIRIYERRDAKTPIRIETRTVSLSELLLERGQYAVTVGGGAGGNVFQDGMTVLWGSEQSHHDDATGERGVAAFALGRYGLSDELTIEAGATVAADAPRAMAGAIARVSPDAVASASVSYGGESGLSTLAQFDWAKADWQVIARTYWRERDGYTTRPATDATGRPVYDPDWDHFLEIAYAVSANLSTGVIARHQPDAAYVLPFARWEPFGALVLEARPDQNGDYRLDGRYTVSRDARLLASYHAGDSSLAYIRDFENRLTLTAEVQRNWRDVWRAGLRLSGGDAFAWDVGWNVGGYISSEGHYDLYAGLRRQVRPGVHVYTDGHYASAPGGFYRYDDRDDMRLRLGLSFDLAMTEDGLAAAPGYGIDRTRGAITGRVRAPKGAGGIDLSGLAVEVDGRKVAVTAADGTFFAANVETGTRLVAVDGENLPIELVARRTLVTAAVAPGAVTELAFDLAIEYGAAGRVTDAAGRPLGGARVTVAGVSAGAAAEAVTNDFGYWRVDGLVPGRYRAIVETADGRSGPPRLFSITDDFVFDIDVRAP